MRAVLPDLGLKGEKAVETEVKKRVIILAVYAMRQGRLWELGDCFLSQQNQKSRNGMRGTLERAATPGQAEDVGKSRRVVACLARRTER